MNAIELQDVSFGYGDRPLFQKFSLAVLRGEFLGILGPNGAGKSTLLRLMAGLLSPQEGEVNVLGRRLTRTNPLSRARLVSLVPQENFFTFDYTVRDVVMWGRHPYLARYARPGPEDWTAVEEALRFTDTAGLGARSVNQISSGERQRVVLARALAQKSAILLLDEVTSHLDLAHQARVMNILSRLRQEGKTIVFLSHDLNWASLYADRLLLLAKGRKVALGVPDRVITSELVGAAYGFEPMIVPHPQAATPQILPRRD